MSNKDIYDAAKEIVKRLHEEKFIAYFAGGSVRDKLMGNDQFNDIDIATSATPEEIKGLFSNVHPVGESFGVMIVVIDKIPFEVATFREDGGYQDGRRPDSVFFSSPQEDAQRRDFTINGMFFDPIEEVVHDFVGGEEDLEKRVIRTIGNPDDRFGEDYLRMLRAIRFAARFDFKIDIDTWRALERHAHNISSISAERIYQELTKMLTGPQPEKAIRMLHDAGLLAVVLPEVEGMVGVEQPAEFHPEGDVFEHTMAVLRNMKDNPSPELAWSALLHDIGKPPTQTFEDRIRFNNHHRVGSEMTIDVLKRLRASNEVKDAVVACVDNHMHFINVQDMRLSKLKKFLARETINTELDLHKADCEASHGSIDNYVFLKAKLEEFEAEGVKPEPFLLGRDLIALGMKPSPEFGEILKDAYDRQLEEEFASREAALDWLKEQFS